MSFLKKIEGPLAFCSITMTIILVSYFFNVPTIITEIGSTLQQWTVVIAAFATFLGVAGLAITHIKRVRRKHTSVWPFSLLTITTMAVVIIVGIIDKSSGQNYQWLFTNLYQPLGTCAIAIMAFYYLEISYRAFRARSFEAGCFTFGVIFVAFRNAPIAGYLWKGFDDIGTWIQMVLSMGPSRGIHLVIGVGMVLLLIRTLTWIDRGHLRGGG